MSKPVIIFGSDEELKSKFAEAVQIIEKENEFLDKWMMHYGALNRNNLERWRVRAKQFLKSLNRRPDDNNDVENEGDVAHPNQ